MKKNIIIILRVYDRIDDLKINIELIKKFWKANNYSIHIVSNGISNGYDIDKSISNKVDNTIMLTKNAGHLKGNSQLLIEGLDKVNFLNFDYAIILEADTWILDDAIITKYIQKLGKDYVWASSEWVENKFSLGLDFAIIDTKFLKIHYRDIFNFDVYPESWICEYLINNHYKYLYIKELMPIHRPSAIKHFYNAYHGRLRTFPLAKMITHHIEDLPHGMQSKKEFVDIMLKKHYFTNKTIIVLFFQYYSYLGLQYILKIIPRSSWYKKKQKIFEKN